MAATPFLDAEPSWLRFHDLMPHRVREILIVSSPYEFFILEEDGHLTERLFLEYSELNLQAAPRISHAPTAAAALALLRERRFDLVLTMIHLADMDVAALGRGVKQVCPGVPVVLVALSEADLREAPPLDPAAVDLVFLWTGDSRLLLAIVKQVEDRLNVVHDTAKGGVRVIVVVEDSVSRYSAFLTVLYTELMKQSQSLIAEGLNPLHRLMRMRARPKLLLACSFEEAVALCDRHRDHLLAVITDLRFPRDGEEDAEAGLHLVRRVRASRSDLPIALQSAGQQGAALARELGVEYFDKDANLLRHIRQFLTGWLGFGDFVFRLPDGTEVARARDMYELERVLPEVPAASLKYHSSRNHISLWLTLRSMFTVARVVRATRIGDYADIEDLRRSLVAALREARLLEQEGAITELSRSSLTGERRLVRLGDGSLGGKARGLAFVNYLLARERLADRFAGLEIRLPRTVAIATDHFDDFIDRNGLADTAGAQADDAEILERFLAGQLGDALTRDLRLAFEGLRGPLAVRSSSLLEDSHAVPFAGIYATYMLPNNHPDPEVRFDELCRAIRAVYASTYGSSARSYMTATGHSLEEEKMGVVLQEVVGARHGDRFYPHVSGVARSYNFYPIGHQKAEDGLALVALGLGQIVVQGGRVVQFSPSLPEVSVQFASSKELLRYSQASFLALDLSRPRVDFLAGPEAGLASCDLETAERDGTLALVASTYVPDEDRVRDDLHAAGPRVVTFHNILKWKAIPLAPALAELLRTFRAGVGCPVELEFAVDLRDHGRNPPRGREPRPPCLYVLQVRPQGRYRVGREAVDTDNFPRARLLCRTDRALGHGVIDGLRDIVYVKRADLDSLETRSAARSVGEVNGRLQADDRPYLLIGPGRWGSSDPGLGISVSWSQIAGARVIVETQLHGRAVEPSQGTHFFHNMTAFQMGYLTLGDPDGDGDDGSFLDTRWLAQQPAQWEDALVRHVRLAEPARAYLDGRQGKAAVVKPD